MKKEEYWYWICNINELTPFSLGQILSVFDGPEEVYEASAAELKERTGLNTNVIDALVSSGNRSRIQEGMASLERKGIRFICREDPEFPERLKKLKDCPYSLYVRGSLPDPDVPSVSMVGSRACSGYGREYALKYSGKLAMSGIQTVSGMATGIDSICARGTIDAGGRTFAVLGSGVDVIYPRENMELYYSIITSGGGIISEYPAGTKPLPWQFPHRNRIISGLGDILLVMEAGARSGTLSTAMHALDQGKDVWALPGRVNDRLSEGCNELISDGAGVLSNIDRVIDILTLSRPETAGKRALLDTGIKASMSSRKALIYGIVGFEPVDIRDIINRSAVPAEEAVEILSELELDNLIDNVAGSYYVRK